MISFLFKRVVLFSFKEEEEFNKIGNFPFTGNLLIYDIDSGLFKIGLYSKNNSFSELNFVNSSKY